MQRFINNKMYLYFLTPFSKSCEELTHPPCLAQDPRWCLLHWFQIPCTWVGRIKVLYQKQDQWLIFYMYFNNLQWLLHVLLMTIDFLSYQWVSPSGSMNTCKVVKKNNHYLEFWFLNPWFLKPPGSSCESTSSHFCWNHL